MKSNQLIFLICFSVSLASSIIIFGQLYREANDPNLVGNLGYVSDEIWYADSARSILRDFFGIQTSYIDQEGYAYYTILFKDFKSRDAQYTNLSAYLVSKNGSIYIIYTQFPALAIKLPKNASFEFRLQNVTMFFTGYPYPDVSAILTYYNLEHPPLAKYVIGLSMLLNGDYPLSWRLPSIILTSLIPIIVFLIVNRFSNPVLASISSLIPLLDILIFNMGFLALLDVYLAFFIALSLLFSVYKRYFLASIFIGLAISTKLSGAFLVFPFLIYLLFVENYSRIKVLILSIILPGFIWFITNIPLIFYLGLNQWFENFLSSLRWHTTSRPVGPPTSYPWEWIINRNPFYFHFNPTYSASVTVLIYVSSFLLLLATPYLYSKKSRLYSLPSLWLLGMFLGYSALPLLGNRTLYSFYVFSFSPMIYSIIASFSIPLFFDYSKNSFSDIYNYYSNLVKTKLKSEKSMLLFAYSISMLISFILHLPIYAFNFGLYSDIVYSIFPRPGIGEDYLGFPYIDYKYEYPVLAGILTYLASGISWLISPSTGTSISLTGQMIFYIVISIFCYIAGYFLVKDMLAISKRIGVSFDNVFLFAGMPSLIIYGIYNWDLIAIALAIRGIRLFLEGRNILSSLFVSLAIATKLYPLFIALAISLELFRRGKRKLLISFGYFLSTLLLFLLYNLPFIVLNFDLWYQGQIAYHLNWYIEGSWLILLYWNPFRHNAQIISIALLFSFIFLIFYSSKRKKYINADHRLIEVSFLMISSAIFASYIHTPQQQLLILPLLLLQTFRNYILILIFDFLNALVILSWFNYKQIGLLLFGYYPPESIGGQLHPLAFPTLCAIIRDFIMLYIILLIILSSSGGIRTHVLGSRAPQD